MKVIKRILRGTSFVVTLGLNEIQYRHFRVAEGVRPAVPVAMNPEVMREMINLVAHLRKIGPFDHREEPVLHADEVREAMEVKDG